MKPIPFIEETIAAVLIVLLMIALPMLILSLERVAP